jgi:hypothetical protein
LRLFPESPYAKEHTEAPEEARQELARREDRGSHHA